MYGGRRILEGFTAGVMGFVRVPCVLSCLIYFTRIVLG